MDQEKEIEEMAELIRAENYRMYQYHDGYIRTPKDIATHLVEESGYRKADEVRKETAEKIFKAIASQEHISYVFGNKLFVVGQSYIAELAKQYGVEIE